MVRVINTAIEKTNPEPLYAQYPGGGNELKANAAANLTSEYGLQMRSLRPVEVESVFGDIKGNSGICRFVLKGLSKVKLEWGLYCIAHNMRKFSLFFHTKNAK